MTGWIWSHGSQWFWPYRKLCCFWTDFCIHLFIVRTIFVSYQCYCKKRIIQKYSAQIQVDYFQKVLFLHIFLEKFDKRFPHSSTYFHVEFSLKFFDKIVIKRDFLKMINLYEPSAPVRKYSEVSTTDTHILYWSHNSESQKGKGK